MKHILWLLTTTLTFSGVFAQTTSQHILLSLNGGLSSPTGNFAKHDYSDLKSGFAGSGGHANITGTYYFDGHLGVSALIGYSGFAYKGSQSLSDGYKEDSGTDSTTLYRNGNNYTMSYLIGPTYRFAIGKMLYIDARVLAGYTNTHLAGFKIYYEDYTTNAMSQEKTSGGGFGLQGGLGVGVRLSKHLAVQVNADYFTSKPKINIQYDNFVVNSGRKLADYNEAVSGINATMGIAFTF